MYWLESASLSAAWLALLSASHAHASFGIGSVGFVDRFFLFGVVVGVVAIPVMAIALAVVSVLARSRQRSWSVAAGYGAVYGGVSWVVAAAVTAAGMQMSAFSNTDIPWLLGIATLIIFAVASAIHARAVPAGGSTPGRE